jgi:hypothetical protein
MQNILGISLKTKLLGMAIFYNGELSDYRVRTFYGVWTQKKRSDMNETIRKLIKRYGISAVSLKTPIPAHCSQSIRDIINDIRQLTEQLCVKLSICTISALKKLYGGNLRGNKQTLIQAIVCRYPHHPKLAQLYGRERSNRHAYHVKIFEAIACGDLALRTLQ